MPKNHLPISLSLAQPASTHATIDSRSAYLRSKRLFDIAATVAIAPIALPLVGLLALLVRLDGEKAFYSQMRIGKEGKAFRLWKLRTMVPQAAERLNVHLAQSPEARSEWECTQKLKDDPRVTRIGRYLRKFSFDELPQLWNVFRGDMSLVGPRPFLPEQRTQYPGMAYFHLRPGLTGLWQISERNNCSFAERAVHDNQYYSMMSFTADLWILAKTPMVVFRGTGV